jgi:hypothetical protein
MTGRAQGTDGPAAGQVRPPRVRSAGQTSETQDRFRKTGGRLDGCPVRQLHVCP